MAAAISKKEAAQLEETVRMFEDITNSQPEDWQSLAILKEAYDKLGRAKDMIRTSRRLAAAYVQVKKLGKAIKEYESLLKLQPDDFDAKYSLAKIQRQAGTDSECAEEKSEQAGSENISAAEDIARRNAQLKLELEAEARGIQGDPVALHSICWMSVKVLDWNLPFRGFLLKRWRRFYQANSFTISSDLAWAAQRETDLKMKIFALEMLLALPRREQALRELLPLESGEPGEENDQLQGARYRAHFLSLGPDAASDVRCFAEFAGEFREAIARESAD